MWEAVGVIAAALFGSGGAVKMVLNGSAQRIKNIDAKMDAVTGTLVDHGERLARIEGTCAARGPLCPTVREP